MMTDVGPSCALTGVEIGVSTAHSQTRQPRMPVSTVLV